MISDVFLSVNQRFIKTKQDTIIVNERNTFNNINLVELFANSFSALLTGCLIASVVLVAEIIKYKLTRTV